MRLHPVWYNPDMSTAKPAKSQQAHDSDEISSKGLAIYEGQLKGQLEPKLNGQFVSIHVLTGDYATAARAGAAIQAIRSRRADGPLVTMKIGSAPEYGLASRLGPSLRTLPCA
jgi:hypothetical protein